jgi:hypothetical protein
VEGEIICYRDFYSHLFCSLSLSLFSYCTASQNITTLLVLKMSRTLAAFLIIFEGRGGSTTCYDGLGNWDVVWSVVSIAILIICRVAAATLLHTTYVFTTLDNTFLFNYCSATSIPHPRSFSYPVLDLGGVLRIWTNSLFWRITRF